MTFRAKLKNIIDVRIIAIMLVIAMAFTLTACGGIKAQAELMYEFDDEAFVNNVLDTVSFECELKAVSEDGIDIYLGTNDADNSIMYMGSGTYADSFGVFHTSEDDGMAGLEETINNYLSQLRESYARYIPEEAAKIENSSVVLTRDAGAVGGGWVAFAITEDSANFKAVFDGAFTEIEVTEASLTELAQMNEEETAGEDTDAPETDTGSDSTSAGELEIEQEEVSDKYDVIETDEELKDYGNIVTVGDSAYELYSYVDDAAKSYARLVNKTAKGLDGISKVYDMVIPLSSGITLPDKYYTEISSSNQQKSLEAIYEKLSDRVTPVNIYDTMMKHRTEYLYFRTDHHWTSLGAYYAYLKWAEVKGVHPVLLEQRETTDYGDFLGYFFTATGDKTLKKNPDNLTVIRPLDNVYIKTKDASGNTVKKDLFNDVTDYALSEKYSTFIWGDSPKICIINDDVKGDSCAIVVKESFGNAFVPYIADYYHKVYVIDYRYWEGDLIELAKEKSAEDVIFVNNIGMTRSSYLVGQMEKIIG